MMKSYIVIAGTYDNKTNVTDFVQAIGFYYDIQEAYGAAFLHLNDSVINDEKISPLFPLEGDTGYGAEVRHEVFTSFCDVLFCEDKGK